MVNNGDVHIEKPSDRLVAQCFSCSACVLTLGAFDFRGTLMSYTDHSVQRGFKSNAPTDWISQHCLVIT